MFSGQSVKDSLKKKLSFAATFLLSVFSMPLSRFFSLVDMKLNINLHAYISETSCYNWKSPLYFLLILAPFMLKQKH